MSQGSENKGCLSSLPTDAMPASLNEPAPDPNDDIPLAQLAILNRANSSQQPSGQSSNAEPNLPSTVGSDAPASSSMSPNNDVPEIHVEAPSSSPPAAEQMEDFFGDTIPSKIAQEETNISLGRTEAVRLLIRDISSLKPKYTKKLDTEPSKQSSSGRNISSARKPQIKSDQSDSTPQVVHRRHPSVPDSSTSNAASTAQLKTRSSLSWSQRRELGQQSSNPNRHKQSDGSGPFSSLQNHASQSLPNQLRSNQQLAFATSPTQPSYIVPAQSYVLPSPNAPQHNAFQMTNVPQLGYNEYLKDIKQNAQFLWGMDAKYKVITCTYQVLQQNNMTGYCMPNQWVKIYEARLVGYRQNINEEGMPSGSFIKGTMYKSRQGVDKVSAVAALAECLSEMIAPLDGELSKEVIGQGREANMETERHE
ncbi:Nn.00g050560.m01.CDS01 [Neocucurbitaria sp. VM-36]